MFGIALGYEDLLDHDELHRDPVLGAVPGRLEVRRRDCTPLVGKARPSSLELTPEGADCYRRIGHDAGVIEALFVELILDAHKRAPERLVLDPDATDDPLRGRQRRLHETVLDQIRHNLELVRPGMDFAEFNEKSWRIPKLQRAVSRYSGRPRHRHGR